MQSGKSIEVSFDQFEIDQRSDLGYEQRVHLKFIPSTNTFTDTPGRGQTLGFTSLTNLVNSKDLQLKVLGI